MYNVHHIIFRQVFFEMKRYYGTKKLGGLSATAISKVARSRGFYESAIITQWNEILPEYAKYTCPLKLYQGTLTLATNSPSAAHNIKMQGPYLMSRINQFFGYGAVKKIQFRIRSFEGTHRDDPVNLREPSKGATAKAQENCKDIPKDDLRESLEKLNALIYSEQED